MYGRELILMMSNFLKGNYDAEAFSFDFPERLSEVYEELLRENQPLCDCLEEDMPEICSWYDPHDTGDEGTYGLGEFKKKVSGVYLKASALL